MQKSIAEEHPELFHYTNATGLVGIIKNHTLWATHYAYLNDSEEIGYFLKHGLRNPLREVTKKFLCELVAQDKNKQSLIDQEGGEEKIIDQYIERTIDILMNKNLAEPYITSFCSTKNKDEQIKEHGLLSQWRGYGREGGYAIVFDTVRLAQLLEEVGKKWEHGGYLFFGDVVYSSCTQETFCDEFGKDLNTIKGFFADDLREYENSKHQEKFYSALMKCACRYKHRGFEEENEVRIITIPFPIENKEFREDVGSIIQEIPRKCDPRSGKLVPYIDLFEDITSLSGKRLPIKRIIVGPSANEQEGKWRIRAVEILLRQYKYSIEEVKVSASEIPYIG